MPTNYTLSLEVKAKTDSAQTAVKNLSESTKDLGSAAETTGQQEADLGQKVADSTKSAEANAAKTADATKALGEMQGAAQDLSANVEDATKTLDDMKTGAGSLSDSIGDTTKSLDDAAKSVDDTSSSLSELVDETADAARTVAVMQDSSEGLSDIVDDTTKSVDDLSSGVSDLSGQVSDTSGSIADTASTLTDLQESAADAEESAADLSGTLADTGASMMDLAAAEADLDDSGLRTLEDSTIALSQSSEEAAQKSDTFAQKIATVKEKAEETEKSLHELGDVATGAFVGVTGALLTAGAAVGVVTKQGLDLTAELENTTTAIKSLQGESFDTEAFLDQLAKTSAATGTSMQDLANAGLALARGNKDVADSLDLVNTLATATQKDTAHTAEVFARALDGNAGALRELSHGYAISQEELAKYGAELDENGKIAATTAEQQEKLKDALQSVIETKYADAIEKHGSTLRGQLEDLSSTMDRLKTSIGESVQEPLKVLVSILTGFLKLIEAAPEWMKKLAVGMGAFGTSVLLATAACWGTIAVFAKMAKAFITGLETIQKLSKHYDTFCNLIIKSGEYYRGLVDVIKTWLTKMGAVKTAKVVDTGVTDANTGAMVANTGAVEANTGAQLTQLGLLGKLKLFWGTYYNLIGACIIQFGLLAEAALAAYAYYKLYKEISDWAADETQRGQEVSKEIQESAKSLREGRGAARKWEETQQKYGVTGQSAEQKARELYSRGASRDEIAQIYKSQQAYAQVLLRASKEENASVQSKIAANNAKLLSTELGKVVREMDKISGFRPKNAAESAQKPAETSIDGKNIDENLQKQLEEVKNQGTDSKKAAENIEKLLKAATDIDKTQKDAQNDDKKAKNAENLAKILDSVTEIGKTQKETAKNAQKQTEKAQEDKKNTLPDITAVDYPTAKKAAAKKPAVAPATKEAEEVQHSAAMQYAIATGRAEDFQRALLMEGAYKLKSGGYGPNSGTFNPETYDWRDEKRKSIEEMDKQREAWDRYIHGTPAEESAKSAQSAADQLKNMGAAADNAASALSALYQSAQQQANPQNVQNSLTINSQNAIQNSNTDAIWKHFEEFMKQQNAQKSAFSSVTNN